MATQSQTLPPVQPSITSENQNPSASNTPVQTDEQPQSREQRTGQNPEQNTNKSNSPERTKFIKPIFEPKKKPNKIKFELPPDKAYQDEFSESLGNFPFLWYNAYQIEYNHILNLKLFYDNNIPTLNVTFKDSQGKMKSDGMPLDDSKISLFLNPRTKFLKPVHLDFKIIEFSENREIYDITGVIDVNELYLKRFQSYQKLTSYELYSKVAQEIGLGYNSNLDNTDDRMTWINPGDRLINFLNNSQQITYKSDDTFISYYIDFYYCVNYVDVEKEIRRDISKELGISNTGINEIVKSLNQEDASRNVLTNDFAAKNSNYYFENYTIINNSTSISLKKGYLTKVKYYDQLKKNFLVFNVDSITSDTDKSIILKGAPQDEKFFNENINLTYNGKLDEDNMHKNFNYAPTQNKINYAELDKIGMIIELINPNYNLYKFQNIYLILSNQKPSVSRAHINGRLTGQWMITDISFTFTGGNFRQRVELTRRDLQLHPEELLNEGPQNTNKGKDSTQTQGNENPII
jgi:hypothetical protein